MHNRIKQVIVVPYHHITPEAQVQTQLKGAHRVPAGQRLQSIGRERVGIQTVPQSLLDAVKVAVGIRAGLRRALAVLLHTDFVLGGQGDAAQLQLRVCPAQQRQRIFCRRTGCAAGRQVKDRPTLPQCLQCRE